LTSTEQRDAVGRCWIWAGHGDEEPASVLGRYCAKGMSGKRHVWERSRSGGIALRTLLHRLAEHWWREDQYRNSHGWKHGAHANALRKTIHRFSNSFRDSRIHGKVLRYERLMSIPLRSRESSRMPSTGMICH